MADQASSQQGQAPSPAERLAAGLAGVEPPREQPEQQNQQSQAPQQGQGPANGTSSTEQQQQQSSQEQDSWLNTLPPQARDEIRRLRGEAAGYRTNLRSVEQERDQLRQANETEAEKIKRERDEAVAERDRYKAEVMRAKVIAEKQLPASAAQFLTGSTEEELAQNADKLKAMLGDGGQPARPDFGAGARPTGGDGDDMNALIRRSAGRVA